MKTKTVKLTFIREILGLSPANKDLYEEFIASKIPLEKERIDKELETLPLSDAMDKKLCVFHHLSDGTPFYFDYQVKAFFKEQLGMIVEWGPIIINKQKCSKWTFKRFADNYIFIDPEEVLLIAPDGEHMTYCTRSLRADTQQGPRISLACSEQLPRGTTCEFTVKYPDFFEEVIIKILDNGQDKGLSQWRNSGKGRFVWSEIETQGTDKKR
jgi:hypothetical protein